MTSSSERRAFGLARVAAEMGMAHSTHEAQAPALGAYGTRILSQVRNPEVRALIRDLASMLEAARADAEHYKRQRDEVSRALVELATR